LFFARQIKDKTGSAAKRKKVLDREKVKTDNNHVPTSVDAYNDGALEEWFNDRDLATDLQLSLNKNNLASMGSNFCDHTKLGFKDAAALEGRTKSSTSSTSDRQTEWWCGSFTMLFLSIRKRRRPHVPNCTVSCKTMRSRRFFEAQLTTPTTSGLPSRGESQLCRSGARYATSTRA
jgi:hypothetical protein